jgi:hypothetical protein
VLVEADDDPVDAGAWDDCCARAIEADRPIAASEELKANVGRRKPRLLAWLTLGPPKATGLEKCVS